MKKEKFDNCHCIDYPKVMRLKDLQEVIKSLEVIGKYEKEIESFTVIFKKKIKKLQTELENEIKWKEKYINQLMQQIFLFAQENRKELTENERRKIIQLATREFGWRKTSPAVLIENSETVLKILKKKYPFLFESENV